MTSENERSSGTPTEGAPGALVTVESVGDVAVLQLNDPRRRNALSPAMSAALADAVDTSVGAGAGALVLTAHPPTFCSGGSLDDLITPVVSLRGSYAGYQRLADAPVPTIAAVGGAAVGAGVNLPLACDVVIAARSARFDPRFLDVGIHPGGGHLWRLAGRVGEQGAAALVLCGDRLTGEEAARCGLAWRCVEDDELVETALSLARRAAARPRDLVVRTKATLRASRALTDPADAAELELAAQEWSVNRPGYREHLIYLRDQLRGRRGTDTP